MQAAAKTAAQPTAVPFDEARAVGLIQDLPQLMAVATPAERKAVVRAVFEKISVEGKTVVGLTPRTDVGPVLAGLANTLYGERLDYP